MSFTIVTAWSSCKFLNACCLLSQEMGRLGDDDKVDKLSILGCFAG